MRDRVLWLGTIGRLGRDREGEQLSRDLQAQIVAPAEPAARIGLEHEYRVFAGDRRIDFRFVIHRLNLGQPNLDPGDPNAYRLQCGATLTCDEQEAEIAFPALPLAPGFTAELARAAAERRAGVDVLLGEDARLEGYSTHLSVSVPPKLAERIARLYAITFAPAMMLMLDRRESPGLLVRPRPGRVELCGEFAQGSRLGAAAAFAAGSVLACGVGDLPPRVVVDVRPDNRRHGWYVDRRAFGGDLYGSGRNLSIRRAKAGTMTAQQALEAGWAAARRALGRLASARDLELAEAMVTGAAPLPIESEDEVAIRESALATVRAALGDILIPRARPGFELAPVMVTWEVVIFLVVKADRRRHAFMTMPTASLRPFLEALAAGELDAALCAYLERASISRRLHRRSQTSDPGLFDELGPRRALLPNERPCRRAGGHFGWRPALTQGG